MDADGGLLVGCCPSELNIKVQGDAVEVAVLLAYVGTCTPPDTADSCQTLIALCIYLATLQAVVLVSNHIQQCALHLPRQLASL